MSIIPEKKFDFMPSASSGLKGLGDVEKCEVVHMLGKVA